MLIGFISDIHATLDPLDHAIKQLKAVGVSKIYCCGDICGYGRQLPEVIDMLMASNVACIAGNHERWIVKQAGNTWDSDLVKVWNYCEGGFQWVKLAESHKQFINDLPDTIQLQHSQRTIHIVHAEPPNIYDSEGIQLLDYETQEVNSYVKEWWQGELTKYGFDILVVGHTHQAFSQQLGEKRVINPSSTLFNGTYCYMDTNTYNIQHRNIYSSLSELKSIWHENNIDKK